MADFFTDTDVIPCSDFISDWGINYAGLGFAIVTRNLTVLALKGQSFFDRLFKRQKYQPFDSELLIKIIRDDPTELYDRFLLRSEVENMDKSTIFHEKIDWTGLPKKRAIVPKKIDRSEANKIDMYDLVSRGVRFSKRKVSTIPSDFDWAEEEAKFKRSKEYNPPKLEKKITPPEGTAPGSIQDIIEDHDSEIKRSPNVYSLVGKVWFVKYNNKEWGLFPDQEKYKYIAHLLHLTEIIYSRKQIDISDMFMYNSELVARVKEKDIDEVYGQPDDSQLNSSSLTDTLSKDDLENLKQVGYDCQMELKSAKESQYRNRIDDAEEKIGQYRAYLLKEHGIKTTDIDEDTRITFKVLYRPGKENEKLRQTVKNQTSNALKDISESMPHLKRHLRYSIKTTADRTIYDPEHKTPWHTSL